MEHQELERVSVARGKVEDRVAHQLDGFVGGAAGGGHGGEEEVVDGEGDEGGGQAAEVLFEGGSDGVDVEVGVGDVEVAVVLEALFDALNLGVAAGFAVDAFDVHAYEYGSIRVNGEGQEDSGWELVYL